jgi:hypothetical protein
MTTSDITNDDMVHIALMLKQAKENLVWSYDYGTPQDIIKLKDEVARLKVAYEYYDKD